METLTTPITVTCAAITGKLAWTADEVTHDWAEGAVAKLNENAGEYTAWLTLADRLDDENNPAAFMIRILFDAGFTLPDGFTGRIERSGTRLTEDGETVRETLVIAWENETRERWSEFARETHAPCIKINGDKSDRNAAVIALTQAEYNSAILTTLTIVGSKKPTTRIIPEGTEVVVYKRDGDIHASGSVVPTALNIEVPANITPRVVDGVEVLRFVRKNWIVEVRTADVIVS